LKKLIGKVHRYEQKGHRINLPGFLAYFYHRFLEVPKGNKSKIVSFPPLALQSKHEVLVGSLRGLIDGEGNINTYHKNVNINITTSSLRLALGTITSLLRLGVSSSIRKSNKDSTWTISINRGNIEKFIEEIKFLRCPSKNEALTSLKSVNATERLIVPHIGSYIKKIRTERKMSSSKLAKKIGLSNTRPIEDIGNFHLNSLIRINNVLKDKRIYNLIKKDLRWCKVIDIKKVKVDGSFNFPKTKGFLLLNHIFVKS